jgi:hypothetical protein
MEGPWHGGHEWSTCPLGGAVKPQPEPEEAAVPFLSIPKTMPIYFLRKKGTTDQFYQRRGGRKCRHGCKRGTRTLVWGPMETAACWTSPNGPRPIKGADGEIVEFPLGGLE